MDAVTRPRPKPETGYASEDTVIASVFGHPRNNFTYLGPPDIGTWAHYAKQAQSSETSGFGKPVTRQKRENTRNYLSWGILRVFLGKMVFLVAKHRYLCN